MTFKNATSTSGYCYVLLEFLGTPKFKMDIREKKNEHFQIQACGVFNGRQLVKSFKNYDF